MSNQKKTHGLTKLLTVTGIVAATLAGLAIVTKLAKNHFANKGEDVDDDFWSDDDEEGLPDDFWDDEYDEEEEDVNPSVKEQVKEDESEQVEEKEAEQVAEAAPAGEQIEETDSADEPKPEL